MSDGATEQMLEERIKPTVDGAIKKFQEAALLARSEAPDMVNSPPHYQGKVECIDAIESAIDGLSGMEGMCTGNAIKYLWRWKRKGGYEDLRKARYYINRLLGDA